MGESGSLFPPKKIASYQYYFHKVFEKRLRFLNRIAFLLSIACSLLLAIPYENLLRNIVYTFIFRAPLIYLALYLIKQSRLKNSTVGFSTSKTLAQHVVRSVCTSRFIATLVFYVFSSYVIYGVFMLQLPLKTQYSVLSKEYRMKPAINDEWVFFWFHAYFIAILYATQQIVFQRNRLEFKYGVNHKTPDSALFRNISILFGHSVSFNVISIIASPISFYILRSIIYKINWIFFTLLSLDSSTPRFHISFKVLVDISFVSFVVFFLWELVNHVFDTYATIGCLDGKRLISSYSSDPVDSLLACLRDVEPENEIARLTAFQELAFIATAKEPEAEKCRKAIYNAHSVRGSVWTAILDECAMVIKETSSRVNYRTAADMKALKRGQPESEHDLPATPSALDNSIFGNSGNISFNETYQCTQKDTSPVKPYAAQSASGSRWKKTITDSGIFKLALSLLKTLDNYLLSLSEHPRSTKPSLSLKKKVLSIEQLYNDHRARFLSSPVGIFFRITLKRDTESRLVNPVNYGNAVIALSGFLSHAIEEDRSKAVTDNHISEVLNLLERPICACANYTDMIPASVYLSPEQRANPQKVAYNLIALLHDLTIREFFQLCVKYNYKLNDLLLSSRAFKLAKWVIDASIMQQQKQGNSTDLYY